MRAILCLAALSALAAAEGASVPLDLSAAFNRGLRDEVAHDGAGGWTDQGSNDLRGQAPGILRVGGFDFRIADPARHGGNAVLALAVSRPGFARAARLAATGTWDRLLLLHATAWTPPPGQTVGTATFLYGDGGEAEAPVRAGEQVADWWKGSAAAATVALREANPQRSPVYLSACALANPHPQRALAGVRLRPADPAAAWLVLDGAWQRGAEPLRTAIPAQRDRSAWPAFKPGIAPAAQPLLDLSHLLHRPAGAHGAVRLADGRLEFADGTPVRFWGVNIHCDQGALPEADQARRIALTLARYGVNLVRLHYPEKILSDRGVLSQNADRWQRFDRLWACLKEQGIYILLDSATGLAGVRLGEAEGIAGEGRTGPWMMLAPRYRELGAAFLGALLARTNGVTGLPLGSDPALAGVVLVNEQSALFEWNAFRHLPPTYRELYRQRFATFLRARHRDRAGLAAAWGAELGAAEDPADAIDPAPLPMFPWPGTARGARRTADTATFLAEVQAGFDGAMRAAARAAGCRAPVMGTNMAHCPLELAAMGTHELTGHNTYYDHVSLLADGALAYHNVPLVEVDPLRGRSFLSPMAAARLAGRGFLTTETDIMWPQEWRASYGLAVAAGAALQGWDGIVHAHFHGGYGVDWARAEAAGGVMQPTMEFSDPALVGLYPAAALILHRGDVAPGQALVQMVRDDRLDPRTFATDGDAPFGYLAATCRVETVFGAPDGRHAVALGGPGGIPWPPTGAATPAARAAALVAELKRRGVIPADRGLQGGRGVSDTGEVVHDWAAGLISVDTPRTQGFTGFPRGIQRFTAVEIDCATPFATVLASSLDGAPLAQSRRLLVTAVARAENDLDRISYGEMVRGAAGIERGERLVARRGGDGRPGAGTMRIEPVHAVLRLPGGPGTVIPLAPDLGAGGPARPCPAHAGHTEIAIGEGVASVWYLVER
jgi:hypothetical protein